MPDWHVDDDVCEHAGALPYSSSTLRGSLPKRMFFLNFAATEIAVDNSVDKSRHDLLGARIAIVPLSRQADLFRDEHL
ncbi:MAG: hypothetical protein MUD07_01395 [Burkholderiaceae bacterium]|nr:hypothetical protein [Burkholderiaceae bacterium]